MALLAGDITGYIQAGYTESGFFEADPITVQATLSATCATDVVTISGLCGTYTWDSTAPFWDHWPNNIWGPEGWCAHVQTSMTVSAGLVMDQPVPQVLPAAVSVQAVGNHIFQQPVQFDIVTQLTGIGNYILKGAGQLDSVFTSQIQGNHIFEQPVTLAGAAAMLIPLSGLLQSAQVQMLSEADFDIGITGIVSQNTASLAAAFSQNIDQSGLNGTAGLLFTAQALLPAIDILTTFAVFIYRDPYRSLIVSPESRVLVARREPMPVLPCETRIIKVYDLRVLPVKPEDRVLIEGIAPYATTRRRQV